MRGGPDEAEQASAWPALEREHLDGWLLRFSRGVTRRANSVLPVRAPGDLATAVREVERRYAARGLPPTFQVGASSRPASLAGALVDRGYREVSPTAVLAADGRGLRGAAAPSVPVRSAASPQDDGWLRTWWSLDGPESWDDARVAAEVMAGAPSGYLSAQLDGETVGVLRATPVGGSLGLACLAVDPAARRRGVASALVRAAAATFPEAQRVWLQVLASSRGARALYDGLGFEPVGGYCYLVAPRVHG